MTNPQEKTNADQQPSGIGKVIDKIKDKISDMTHKEFNEDTDIPEAVINEASHQDGKTGPEQFKLYM